jgi:hypothetical protein
VFFSFLLSSGKDVKSGLIRTVKMTIRGITVLVDGTDDVVVTYAHTE